MYDRDRCPGHPPRERHPKIMNAFDELDKMRAEKEEFGAESYEMTTEGPERFVATFPKQ